MKLFWCKMCDGIHSEDERMDYYCKKHLTDLEANEEQISRYNLFKEMTYNHYHAEDSNGNSIIVFETEHTKEDEKAILEYLEIQDAWGWLDVNMNVHYGCDCGCGGDSHSEESWEAEIEKSAEYEEQMNTILFKFINMEDKMEMMK